MKRFLGITIMTVLLTVIVAVSLSSAQTAQQSQQPTADQYITVKKSDLPSDLVQRLEMKSQLASYGEYAGLGKEIGIAFKEGLGAITGEATKLADSNLGQYIMFLIAWKVLGMDAIQLVVGMPLLLIFIVIFSVSYYRNCVPRHVVTEKEGKKKKYQVTTPDKMQQLAHACWGVVFLVICLVVIFA